MGLWGQNVNVKKNHYMACTHLDNKIRHGLIGIQLPEVESKANEDGLLASASSAACLPGRV